MQTMILGSTLISVGLDEYTCIVTDECVDVPSVHTNNLEFRQSAYSQTHITDMPLAFAQTESLIQRYVSS